MERRHIKTIKTPIRDEQAHPESAFQTVLFGGGFYVFKESTNERWTLHRITYTG